MGNFDFCHLIHFLCSLSEWLGLALWCDFLFHSPRHAYFEFVLFFWKEGRKQLSFHLVKD